MAWKKMSFLGLTKNASQYKFQGKSLKIMKKIFLCRTTAWNYLNFAVSLQKKAMIMNVKF